MKNYRNINKHVNARSNKQRKLQILTDMWYVSRPIWICQVS